MSGEAISEAALNSWTVTFSAHPFPSLSGSFTIANPGGCDVQTESQARCEPFFADKADVILRLYRRQGPASSSWQLVYTHRDYGVEGTWAWDAAVDQPPLGTYGSCAPRSFKWVAELLDPYGRSTQTEAGTFSISCSGSTNALPGENSSRIPRLVGRKDSASLSDSFPFGVSIGRRVWIATGNSAKANLIVRQSPQSGTPVANGNYVEITVWECAPPGGVLGDFNPPATTPSLARLCR